MLMTVRVLPRSRKNSVEWEQGNLKVHLADPPVDGAANDALIAFLADHLGLPKRAVTVVRGATSRQKIVEITGLTPEEVKLKLMR
ncbi:MAG: hypothetical protein NVSMB33_06060 [Ktedonobacteraceae bacterium]